MHTDSAFEAQEGHCAYAPTGLRKLTISLLQATRAAEDFSGLPPNISRPSQILSALKSAASCLGLPTRLVHVIDWLFKFTQPQDWEPGHQPIVWPSAALQRDALGLSETQVKAINRGLIAAGLIAMKDSPNGKRYGKRNREGHIVEAYGFDLSPLAARYDEFIQLAAAAKEERIERGKLRRRATIARNGMTQILETVTEQGLTGEEWTSLLHDSRRLTQTLSRIESLDELTFAVQRLERQQREAREHVENMLAQAQLAAAETLYTASKQAEYRPHQYNYKSRENLKPDTVVAHEGSGSASGPVGRSPDTAKRLSELMDRQAGRDGTAYNNVVSTDNSSLPRLTINELLILAPRLQTYLTTPRPVWHDVVDAADWLRGELGISQPLWGEACLLMGREWAAVGVALVSARPVAHFRTSPGGYFHGMVRKAKTGELNLARTLWGLRQAKAAKPQYAPVRIGSQAPMRLLH
jgi:replication initiation protein RepC